jgi:glycosyltransferase involved in cell wall biosynthesis
VQIALASAHDVARARLTVRTALSTIPSVTVHVLDLDGTYRRVGSETVHALASLDLSEREVHRRAVALEPSTLARSLLPEMIRGLRIDPGEVVAFVTPGLLLLRPPTMPEVDGLALVSRTGGAPLDDGRHPDELDVARTGRFAPLVLVRPDNPDVALFTAPGSDITDEPWSAETVAALVPHTEIEDPTVVLSAASLRPEHDVAGSFGSSGLLTLTLDGCPVGALDLTGLDPSKPWLLDARAEGDPRGRLSEHPELAALVRTLADAMLADAVDEPPSNGRLTMTSLGIPLDEPLRALYRSLPQEQFGVGVPDPLDAHHADALLAFLTQPVAGGPSRYLRMVHATRPDLQQAFPRVPGADGRAFVAWAARHAVVDGYPAAVVEPALRQAPRSRLGRHRPPRARMERLAREGLARRPQGVNVVGFLRGELGIGESARLIASALGAAGTPHRTIPIDQHLASRQGVVIEETSTATVYATTLLCVNADLTPAVSASLGRDLASTYRIGMWYWEVEDFPPVQHGGFRHVDEVWVATDFVRRAIEPHSPVPVRTVTPPLPQRGSNPISTRADLGLPDGPLFLFSFDFLSTAERKNPWGLVEAFSMAFAPGEGPTLVIKSINAEKRPGDAERLKLAAAGRPDVLLMERYLDPAERDALVAHCDCYVSLHRSEGLGLTMAEAMAWGKPVIATAYSGNLQFMTEENSFLVPWRTRTIPRDAAPYPAGGTWADPDLAAAAEAMRLVIDQPDVAAVRGARAAADIASRHSAEAAGRRICEALEMSRTSTARRSSVPARLVARLVIEMRRVSGATGRR